MTYLASSGESKNQSSKYYPIELWLGDFSHVIGCTSQRIPSTKAIPKSAAGATRMGLEKGAYMVLFTKT